MDRGGFLFGGEGGYEITTASFNAKISWYMYKNIYVNTFYCIIIILYMHISSWV